MKEVLVYTCYCAALVSAAYGTPLTNRITDSAKVSVSRKRSDTFDVRVEAFDQVFQLELSKRESPFSKHFSIIADRKETHIQDRSSLPQLYTDKTGESTILLTDHSDGNFAIEGILNERYAIETYDKSETDSKDRKNVRNQLEHLVFRREQQNEVHCDGGPVQNDEDYFGDEEPQAEDILFLDWFFPKTTTPLNLLVEIAVVLDYNSTLAFENDSAKVTNYLSIFYDGVKKWYQDIPGLNIKLEIIAVILTQNSSEDAIKNWVQPSTTVVREFGVWIFANHADIAFDYAVLHTMSDIHGLTSTGTLSPATNGVAYIAEACVVLNKKKVNYNVGIIEDLPKRYTGIRVSAHEMGHNLGCSHDGEAPVKTPKNQPSATTCDPKDGHLMSYFPHDTKAFSFSSCSFKQLKWYSELSMSECLQEKSSRVDVVPLDKNDVQSLPGINISLEEQCKDMYGPNAVLHDPDPIPLVCTQLWCRRSQNDTPTYRGPALEGSKCGNGGICNLGFCVQPNNYVFK